MTNKIREKDDEIADMLASGPMLNPNVPKSAAPASTGSNDKKLLAKIKMYEKIVAQLEKERADLRTRAIKAEKLCEQLQKIPSIRNNSAKKYR